MLLAYSVCRHMTEENVRSFEYHILYSFVPFDQAGSWPHVHQEKKMLTRFKSLASVSTEHPVCTSLRPLTHRPLDTGNWKNCCLNMREKKQWDQNKGLLLVNIDIKIFVAIIAADSIDILPYFTLLAPQHLFSYSQTALFNQAKWTKRTLLHKSTAWG